MSDKLDPDDLFGDTAAVDAFIDILKSDGLVMSTVSDGIVMGIGKDKLAELTKLAEDNEEGLVVIFVKHSDIELPKDMGQLN